MKQEDAVAHLIAAHARAERAARALPRGPWMWVHRSGPQGAFMTLEGPDETPALRTGHTAARSSWIDRHPAFDTVLPDPEAVLRRVEAERRILAEHAESNGDCRTCVTGGWGWPVTSDCTPQRWPCATVLGLAAGWGWEAAR